MIQLKLPNLSDWTVKIDGICWQIGKLSEGQEISLDMQRNKFIEPAGVLMLFLICNQIFNRTGKKILLENLRLDVQFYLDSVKFFDHKIVYATEGISLFTRLTRRTTSKSFVELTQISTPESVASTCENIKKILDYWKLDKFDKVPTIFLELCNNSLEHSLGDPEQIGECYCILQAYRSPKGPKLKISIGDLGVGIRNHLKIKHEWVYNSDSVYIKKVLGGLSGRVDGTGGMGLPFVKNAVENLNGMLAIRSGQSVVFYKNKYDTFEFSTSFPGTQCQIILE